MMRSVLLLLPLAVLAACGGKKSSQDRVEWGQMRELFPPGMEAPPARAEPPAAPTAAAVASEARAESTPSAADTDELIGTGRAMAAEFEETPSGAPADSPKQPAAALKPPDEMRKPAAAAQPAVAAASESAGRTAPAPAPDTSSRTAAPPSAPPPAPTSQPSPTSAAASPPSAVQAAADDGDVSAPAPAPAMKPMDAAPSTAAAATKPAEATTPAATPSHTEPAAAPQARGWPRTLTAHGTTFKIQEPQPDAWNEDALMAHALVTAQSATRPQPALGALRLTARTRVDDSAGVVRLSDVQITGARFPDVPDKTLTPWIAALRAGAPELIDSVSIPRVQTGMAAVRARDRGAAVLQVSAPRIVLAKKPTVLVYIDGDPRFVPIKNTSLAGVLNTRTILLRGAQDRVYLRVYDGWVAASSLRGPWQVAKPPPEAAKVEQAARATGRANLLRGKPDAKGRYPSLAKDGLPQIVVATKPTAVLLLDGEPRFAQVPGTSLQYATNSTAHVFRDVESKQIYVRVAGYWYRSTSAAGPWEFVPVASLPVGFLSIPDSSPKAAVKSAIVAGRADTPAPDAASAPVMVAADPSRARLNVTLDGDPKLEPIPGTQLNYVANASVPIIQFDDTHWYAIQNGVWFSSGTATGPWRVTADVPPEIYAIPPTVPIYAAIHSRVYSSSSDTVYYGYENPQSLGGASGGAVGVEDQGQDYLYTPPAGLYWGWYY